MYTSGITNRTVGGGTTQYWNTYISAESTHSWALTHINLRDTVVNKINKGYSLY